MRKREQSEENEEMAATCKKTQLMEKERKGGKIA